MADVVVGQIADRPRLSWGAIFGGAATALGLWVLLYAFGLAIGLSSLDPANPHSRRGRVGGQSRGHSRRRCDRGGRIGLRQCRSMAGHRLKEDVQHHVEEEEKELFPKVEKVFGDEELETIAAAMEGVRCRPDRDWPSGGGAVPWQTHYKCCSAACGVSVERAAV